MRHIYSLIFLPLLLLAGIGCSKDKSMEEPDVPVTPVIVTLELSDADLVFDATGGQKTFTITSNAEWTITNESEWCTTDVTSGTGNRTVTVTSQTYGELEDRNMNLTVKAGDKSQVLEVTQKGKDAIIPDKAKFEVPQGGGDLAIKVRSNVTYEVVIPEFCNSWIQPAPETRSEISDTTYRFLITENEEDESRMGFIVFSAASLNDTVRIFQAQKDRLVLTQTKYNLSANDTTIVVELRTNVDYDVTILGDAASWISRIETRVSRVDQLQFSIEENTEGVSRTAKIALQDKNSTLSDTVYIKQSIIFDSQDITDSFDLAFASLLQKKGYIPKASHILFRDVKSLSSLNLSNEGLTSLKGIEHFESLTYLDCSYNQLTSLNVSKNTALTMLWCHNNQLTDLDVSDCIALTNLVCYSNQLTNLDVSGYTALTYLACTNNQLTNLDVSGCTALTYLNYTNNQLTDLDVSGCTALTYLACSYNQLTDLDVSKNTALIELHCSDNQLTTLDVSGYTALTYLACTNNQLTNLDVSGCTALTDLTCWDNQLTSLNVSGCAALTSLYCPDNQLTSLNVSKNTALTTLWCHNNQLTDLDMSDCIALTNLSCSENQLTDLNVSGCTALTDLTCWDNQLTSLNVSKNTALTSLDCSGNQLTFLNVSKNTALTKLWCPNNQLTDLDVSDCITLTHLSCSENQLTDLDVSKNTALTYLSCSDNPGDKTSIFPIMAWFDNDNIPKNMYIPYTYWRYDNKNIIIDFRKAE